MLVDFGLLEVWSGNAPPLLPEWLAEPSVVEAANRARDFEVTGPDGPRAARLFGNHPRFLYDRPGAFEAAFAEAIAAKGWSASLRELPQRATHRERLAEALRAGTDPGAPPMGAVEFHGVWGIAFGAMPTDRPMAVQGRRREDGRWASVELRVAEGDPARTVPAGSVPVEHACLAFFDRDALDAWEPHEPADGLADYVFWGPDAEEVAAKVEAAELEEGTFGWLDEPVDALVPRAERVESMRTANRLFASDFRPHADPHRLLQGIRAAETESGTLDVGLARVCGFMTTWGDGFFAVEADVDPTGALLAIRVRFAPDDDGVDDDGERPASN